MKWINYPSNSLRNCGRWAFVDLTAGPFSWGPTVGGEGVRTQYSLPNVTKTVGAVTGNYRLTNFLLHNYNMVLDVEIGWVIVILYPITTSLVDRGPLSHSSLVHLNGGNTVIMQPITSKNNHLYR